MEREALRKAAASRRSDAKVERPNVAWHCEFCVRDFQTERGLMDHRCLAREKLDLLKSPVGQAAYTWYSEWMKLQKRSVPPPETFLNSRQFNHMVKFAEWVDKISVPIPTQFIRLMVESGTQPVLWCRDSTYAMYLEWYDGAYPPEQQLIDSLDFIKREWLEHEDLESGNPFDMWNGRELAALVRRRKISPWLLIASEKFLGWIKRQPKHMADLVSETVNFSA